jgi:hypothetical protein
MLKATLRDSLTRLGRPADSFTVFILNFLKRAPIRVRFSLDFLQEQDFPERIFCEFSEAPAVIRTPLEQPHFTFPGENFFADF